MALFTLCFVNTWLNFGNNLHVCVYRCMQTFKMVGQSQHKMGGTLFKSVKSYFEQYFTTDFLFQRK